MIRRRTLALLLSTLMVVGVARAQVGRIEPIASVPVTFTVTDAHLAAAQGCPGCVVVEADPGPGVVFRVKRQNPNKLYHVDVQHEGWVPTEGPTLEVQITVTGENGTPTYLTSDWVAVSEFPTELFDQGQANANRVRVTAAYRLRLNGDEAARTFATSATFGVRGTTEAMTHPVQALVPTFLVLQWVGAPASGTATLRFDYAHAPLAFVDAITRDVPLAPTSADFDRLEVSTNHPSGYTVAIIVGQVDAPSGAPSIAPRLMLAGAAVTEQRFTSTGPTVGFVTLATPADFGLRVDGAETPGPYRVELRYEAVRNP